jgi:hypothetical protein
MSGSDHAATSYGRTMSGPATNFTPDSAGLEHLAHEHAVGLCKRDPQVAVAAAHDLDVVLSEQRREPERRGPVALRLGMRYASPGVPRSIAACARVAMSRRRVSRSLAHVSSSASDAMRS